MKRLFRKAFFGSAVLALALTGCANQPNQPEPTEPADNNISDNTDAPIQIVTTFSIITDITQQIGQDLVEVFNIVPTGTDPHEYEPRPQDVKRANDADLLLYNGLNLEGGTGGWFDKMVTSIGKDPNRVQQVSEGISPLYLHEDLPETVDNINPHAFADPENGIIMAENVRDALISVDPSNTEHYELNAASYIEELSQHVTEYRNKFSEIPTSQRILVTSERAFQYLALNYDFQEGYLWAIDTDENGSPQQVKELVNFIQSHEVVALFVESNVDPRPMETVSQETGIPIAGVLYSDEIGEPGSEVDRYTTYLTHNLDTIMLGLASQQ